MKHAPDVLFLRSIIDKAKARNRTGSLIPLNNSSFIIVKLASAPVLFPIIL